MIKLIANIACTFIPVKNDLIDRKPIPIEDISNVSFIPQYNKTNANFASAALNKWLKPHLPNGCFIHSLR